MEFQTIFPRRFLDKMIAFIVLVLVTSSTFSTAEAPKIYQDGWTSVDSDYRTWNTNESAPLGPGTNSSTFVVPSSVTGLSLICNASYPIEWYFHREKWGRRTTWQTWVTTTRLSDPVTLKPIGFSTELRFLGSDIQITGNYTCQAFGKPDISSSVYIFWEGTGFPLLTLAHVPVRRTIPYNKNRDSFRLPCTLSRPDASVSLAKIFYENTTTILRRNESITYNPAVGFTLQYLPDPFGHYRCTVGDKEDDDFVDFDVIETKGDDKQSTEFNNTKWNGATFEYDPVKRQFTCCSNNNKPPKMSNYDCTHPITCKLRMHVLHNMENNPRRVVDGHCASIKIRGLAPGVIRCVGDSIDLVREYFFPLTNRFFIPRNETVLPYYSWSEADASKMMKLTNLSAPFYIGQKKRFDCQVSPFYYSQGIHWGIKYKNETTYSIKGNQSRIGRRHPFELFMQGNHAFMDLTAEEDLESITCHAPVWNTTEWHNATLKFDIRRPTKPTIDGPSMEEVDWRMNVTNQTLTCRFTGIPTPYVYWRRDNVTIYKNVIKGNVSSTLTIPRVGLGDHGTYYCNVSNIGGFQTKVFNVYVTVGVSAEVVSLYVFAAICILVAGVGGFFGYRKMQEQKESIRRLANVAFKDVVENSPSQQPQQTFPDPGNQFPAVLPTNGNGFSNNGFLNNMTSDASEFGRYHKM